MEYFLNIWTLNYHNLNYLNLLDVKRIFSLFVLDQLEYPFAYLITTNRI